METVAQALSHAHGLYARADDDVAETPERPPVFKVVGIALAVGSGAFIGTSFVLKKVGLLRANEKYNEVAGEGYGYLKNFYWWAGMVLMIIGEGLNFAAYAFTDAILVTPLGALSVVITTILSAIFLKERLSMVGKVACFLCIVGSVVIVMNAPQSSAVANIEEMKDYVIHPAFLSYAGVVIVGSVIVAFWLGPKYGNKNMFVYISICSWVGGLSVVATQGLGAAIIAQASGRPQFNQWFLYVLLAFVIGTLLTEIIFLNKALNLFNAALVTPTYYVYFTSTTIISSAVLFRGFNGTPTSIVTMVNGFLTICSGVVLLQLSKSAKDVPDTAVFAGDLDQIHTIAEQPQPETEPKADAIRGTAAIVRRLSSARQKMELEELKRLREEKLQESLEPLTENGVPQYEWDGIRRRRTGTLSTHRSTTPGNTHLAPPTPHPPLGWSRFPTEEELAEANRPISPALSNFVGSIRSRARSVLLPGHPDFRKSPDPPKVHSPMHPVQLTSVAVPGSKADETTYDYLPPPPSSSSSSGSTRRVQFGRAISTASDAASSLAPPTPPPHSAKRQFSFQNMFKRHHQQSPHDAAHDSTPSNSHHRPLSRHGFSSRSYSTTQVAARGATEEETLGLVKGDSNTARSLPTLAVHRADDDSDDDNDSDVHGEAYADKARDEREKRYGPSITKGYNPPGRARTPWAGGDASASPSASASLSQAEKGTAEAEEEEEEVGEYEILRDRFVQQQHQQQLQKQQKQRKRSGSGEDKPPPPPPPHGGSWRRGPGPGPGPAGGTGSFI